MCPGWSPVDIAARLYSSYRHRLSDADLEDRGLQSYDGSCYSSNICGDSTHHDHTFEVYCARMQYVRFVESALAFVVTFISVCHAGISAIDVAK